MPIRAASCIYCSRIDFTDEHWLPRSFGRFGFELLRTTVCGTCNRELGKVVDEEFIRTGPEGVAKALLGIEGRHDSSPNPVHHKAATTQPVRMNIVDDDGSGFFIEPFHHNGRGVGKPARQIRVTGEDGQQRYLLLNLAWQPETLRSMVDALGLRDARLAEVYCDPEEVEAARALLTPVFPGFTAQAYARDGQSAQHRMRGEFRLATPYFRGLAKIAFHYAIAQAPWISGNEPQFGLLRDFIRNGTGNPWFFVEDATGLFSFVPKSKAARRWAHFLALEADATGVIVRLQLFVGPGFSAFPWIVRLATGAMTAVPYRKGHVAAYFDTPRTDADGELSELEVREASA